MSPYTHPDWELLLKAVCAAPDDDLPRLVAADWLDEHAEPERAEFIRLQIERERHDRPDLKWREKALRDNPLFGWLWAEEACPKLVGLNVTEDGGSPLRAVRVSGAERVTFRRGFAETVRCPAAEWHKYGGGVVPRQPVRHVVLLQCDDLSLSSWWEVLDTFRGLTRLDLDSTSTVLPVWLREQLGGAADVRVNGRAAPRALIAEQPTAAGGTGVPELPSADSPARRLRNEDLA